MYENSVLSINIKTLQSNIEAIFNTLSNTTIIPVLKANAYGHGLVDIAHILSKDTRIKRLALAHLSEALLLRENGISLPLMILGSCTQMEVAKAHNIEVTVYNLESLQMALSLDLKYHLKIDSGLHRLGFKKADLSKLPPINPVSTFSHFIDGTTPHLKTSYDQDTYFKECLDILRSHNIDPGFIHICDSGASEWFTEAHYDAIRIGRGLYMDNPLKIESQRRSDVATWSAELIHIFNLPKNTPLGYNKLIFDTEKTIGILNVGYGDGIIEASMPVCINNQISTVLDSAMDQSYLDLSFLKATLGDRVELYGRNLSSNVYAKRINDEGCALTTSLSPRVKRIYTE